MNQVLSSKRLIENLWGGTVSIFKHDMLEHNLEFNVNVIDSGIEKEYKLKFLQILKLELIYEHPENFWDYVELTEISVNKENGFYNIECDFWSTGRMKLLCQKVMVNGNKLNG